MAEQSGTVASDLDQFLAEHERRAFRMAMIATGEKADALDIVQDAMLKLVRKYAHKPSNEWPALFHRIVQNAINDWFRKEKVRKYWRQWFNWSHGDEEGDNSADPLSQVEQTGTHQPDQVLQQHNAMQRLDELLNALPHRQQQAFLLRQWEGLDVASTARAMGISEGSVKTHYFRAVHSLREQLEEHI
ncbi:MAG: RNA polymerase sigma factor [Thioalkalispiraceae bacterium]